MSDSDATHGPKGTRIISRVLPPAIRFWLSTQLDQVEELDFQIRARDRQVLSGHIPEIALSAQKAVYEGIHLSCAAVTASGIRINLGQVIRRQPLRLLTSFPVSGRVILSEADLNTSLQSPLLGEGLYDFLQLLAQSQPHANGLSDSLNQLPQRTVLTHYAPSASIEANHVILRLHPRPHQIVAAVALKTQLSIGNGHQLCLDNPHWLMPLTEGGAIPSSAPLPKLEGFAIDLGATVSLTTCEVAAGQIILAGTVQIQPATVTDNHSPELSEQ
ncbi:MAG: DUF2993 domain-containing protein [Leptolyngbyaceae cyanobacterium]